jgi:hypothetical protein
MRSAPFSMFSLYQVARTSLLAAARRSAIRGII